MRKFLFILPFLLLVMTAVVQAQVTTLYIACDPDPAVAQYSLEFDGTVYGPMTPIELRSKDTLVMDIAGDIIIDQIHTVRLRAHNEWGDASEWSVPFEFRVSGAGSVIVRGVLNPPAGIKLLSQ